MTRFLFPILIGTLLLAPAPASAQQGRLEGRVDARTRATIEGIVDSARVAGLPAEPLIDKTLEGAMKGAEPARIIGAVRALSRRLAAAREALGTAAGGADLVAAAGALSVGVTPDAIARLRNAAAGAPLATPLVVLSDLVSRGVPADTASAAVVALATRGASDEAYLALRSDVARAIAAGAPPAVATSVRAGGGLVSSPAITHRPTATRAAEALNHAGDGQPAPPRPRP